MKPYPRYFDWLRYICACLLYFYGMAKLSGHQLTVPAEMAQQPIGSLSGYWLTWYYYSYSHLYKDILGLTQVIGASLLLFRKSALLAAVMMTPVMANILLINIFYSISVGAECNSAFILGCMLLLLWHQRGVLFGVLWTSQTAESKSARRLHWIIRSVILVVVLAQVIVGTVLGHLMAH
ncbi:hypothetical protein [Granulicella sp. L46]|uniref:hypothetical protein n=1 Tax=Granulicella sp. L46 TaxID=1641865 RepID=UPI00131ECB60|nr:hypothetical protein [Granulicella sp. L46]